MIREFRSIKPDKPMTLEIKGKFIHTLEAIRVVAVYSDQFTIPTVIIRHNNGFERKLYARGQRAIVFTDPAATDTVTFRLMDAPEGVY